MFGFSKEKKPSPTWQVQVLDDNVLAGLKSFSELLGYVRYFHPSDQAFATDWDRFTVDGVSKIAKAESADELSPCLRTLFEPIAPTLKIFKTGTTPASDTASDTIPQSESGMLHRLWWHHHGLGGSSPFAAYVSERIVTPLANKADSRSAEDTNDLFTGDLPAGLSFAMPVRLYADEQGTLPRRPIPAMESTPPELSATDWQVRVAAVILAWNVLSHFYPYFDVVDIDWSATLEPALTAAAAAGDEPSFYDVLCSLMCGLRDGHAAVGHVDHDDKKIFAPPIAWDWLEDRLVITRVSSKSGASSIAAGQVVLEVDGTNSEEAIAQAGKRSSGSTPEWLRRKALYRIFGGDKDSSIKLKVQSSDGAVDHTLTRTYPLLIAGTYTRTMEESRPDKIAELSPGILYIDLSRISDDDFRNVLGRLERAKGIAFDLRGYPMFTSLSNTFIGHLIDTPILSPHYLTPIREHPDSGAGQCAPTYVWQRLRLEPRLPRLAARAVFLADTRAISYAETMLAFVKGHKVATIIGQRSAGCEGAPSFYQLPGGYTISWTSMRTLRHDGVVHQGKGIEPDICVQPTIAGIVNGRDEILERALAELSGGN